jgi:hypothetical protein
LLPREAPSCMRPPGLCQGPQSSAFSREAAPRGEAPDPPARRRR